MYNVEVYIYTYIFPLHKRLPCLFVHMFIKYDLFIYKFIFLRLVIWLFFQLRLLSHDAFYLLFMYKENMDGQKCVLCVWMYWGRSTEIN